MTVDQAAANIAKWAKFFINLVFLVVVAILGIKSLLLTQNAGIGLAGVGFLYSKL